MIRFTLALYAAIAKYVWWNVTSYWHTLANWRQEIRARKAERAARKILGRYDGQWRPVIGWGLRRIARREYQHWFRTIRNSDREAA